MRISLAGTDCVGLLLALSPVQHNEVHTLDNVHEKIEKTVDFIYFILEDEIERFSAGGSSLKKMLLTSKSILDKALFLTSVTGGFSHEH